jgi:nitrate/nitrite transport system substrate-binding protein
MLKKFIKQLNTTTMKNIQSKIFTITLLLVLTVQSFSYAQRTVKLGFIALTDCAPLVMAKELGLFKKYGIDIVLTKEASWAVIRDKVLNGELDGAHCLFSMPFSVTKVLVAKQVAKCVLQ